METAETTKLQEEWRSLVRRLDALHVESERVSIYDARAFGIHTEARAIRRRINELAGMVEYEERTS